MLLGVVVAIDLVMLTTPDGKYLSVAPSQIVALRGGGEQGHLHHNVHCAVFTVDGKFISVVESCAEVARKLAQHGVVLDTPK